MNRPSSYTFLFAQPFYFFIIFLWSFKHLTEKKNYGVNKKKKQTAKGIHEHTIKFHLFCCRFLPASLYFVCLIVFDRLDTLDVGSKIKKIHLAANPPYRYQMRTKYTLNSEKFHEWPLTQHNEYQLLAEPKWIVFITFEWIVSPSQWNAQLKGNPALMGIHNSTLESYIPFFSFSLWRNLFIPQKKKERNVFSWKYRISLHLLFKRFEDLCN